MSKKFTYDGKSRPVNNLYKENFDRIFKTKVIDSKKVYDRKKQQDELRESYEQSLKNKQDRKEKEKC